LFWSLPPKIFPTGTEPHYKASDLKIAFPPVCKTENGHCEFQQNVTPNSRDTGHQIWLGIDLVLDMCKMSFLAIFILMHDREVEPVIPCLFSSHDTIQKVLQA